MKTVFEASSGLEAHMIQNLLQQYGVDCRIEGEYLQGGVGELQAMNLVRVLVDEADYAKARRLIDEWDAAQVEPTVGETSASTVTGIGSGVIIGIVIGAGMTWWAFNSPLTEHGIDHNGDGQLDERYIYRDKRIVRNETDRNLDGITDLVSHFNRKGLLYKTEADDDFDGVFETTYKYRRGNVHTLESDNDQDGRIDLYGWYDNGLLTEILITGPDPGSPRKRQRFKSNKMIGADYDADGDGRYDITYEYDFFEEIENSTRR